MATRVGMKVEGDSIWRGGGKMEKSVEAVNHQQMHARYGRIKAIHKVGLRNYRLNGAKRWYAEIGGVKQAF